ncbi:MAG: hypothetical protein Q7V57_00695 [Actinomycetota bacterium]|nr:hypothetical protein [Actinomycetota bacterium]
MSEPTTFEIVLRGRASARLLRPLLDDFTFQHPSDGTTRLVGVVRDAAHLHGVVAHLTAVNVELISIVPVGPPAVEPSLPGFTTTNHESSTTS